MDNCFKLQEAAHLPSDRYVGIEWNEASVKEAVQKGLNVQRGDLNEPLPFSDQSFDIVYGLSVIEHLLRPCQWIRESRRVLQENGLFVILTPNIANYFTIFQLLLGKMPSSGPYPDSSALVNQDLVMNVSGMATNDLEDENPVHRHHIIFSYRILKKYLHMVGFREVNGFGFGVYPFPAWSQPLFEKWDKMHCHQMVFICRK